MFIIINTVQVGFLKVFIAEYSSGKTENIRLELTSVDESRSTRESFTTPKITNLGKDVQQTHSTQ